MSEKRMTATEVVEGLERRLALGLDRPSAIDDWLDKVREKVVERLVADGWDVLDVQRVRLVYVGGGDAEDEHRALDEASPNE